MYNRCINGHYYDSSRGACPYCKGGKGSIQDGDTSTQIDPIIGSGGGPTVGSGTRPTNINVGNNGTRPTNMGFGSGSNTTVVEGDTIATNGPGGSKQPIGTNTVFEDEISHVSPTGEVVKEKIHRDTRKLVGWLVTYSLDAIGNDFRLYEGKNTIGRNMDRQITVNDSTVSGTHATIFYRNSKYAIRDDSSNGTFVNGEDIGFDACDLKDGDIIRMGNTIFMIRFALFDVEAKHQNKSGFNPPKTVLD